MLKNITMWTDQQIVFRYNLLANKGDMIFRRDVQPLLADMHAEASKRGIVNLLDGEDPTEPFTPIEDSDDE